MGKAILLSVLFSKAVWWVWHSLSQTLTLQKLILNIDAMK